jgi:hypothetical protein
VVVTNVAGLRQVINPLVHVGVLRVAPLGATDTTRAVAPPTWACGNRSANWLIAC